MRRWRIDFYILREILGPLALGFVIYTFILLLQALFKFAQLIISHGVPFETVGQMLWVSLPRIVVLTIPMSLLFGILIAVGRLSADSELVALRASGVSLVSLSPTRPSMYRPILLLSAALAAANLYLMLEVMPAGNTALERLQVEILSASLDEEIEPRTFYPAWQKKLLFIFEQPPDDNRWKGVFMADAVPASQDEVWIADWGRAQYLNNGANVAVRLESATRHSVSFDDPEAYETVRHQAFERVIDLPNNAQTGISSGRQLRSMRVDDLRDIRDDEQHPEPLRRRALVEIQKRFAIPATCLVFGLLALPLGITRSRGGKSSGFAVSIGIIMAYYVLLNWGEELGASGRVPAVPAVWMANALLLLAGFYILVQRNRDKSLLLARVDKWVQGSLWARVLRLRGVREARRKARLDLAGDRRSKARVVLRLQPMAIRLLGRIDRYVLLSFLRVLVLAMIGGVSIYVIADLTDKIDDITTHNIAADIVLTYYQYKTFSIIYQIAPIIMLIATLITFALLSHSNEITAIKALGVSLYRLTLPVVVAAVLIAGLAGVIQSEVLPASNQRVAELEAVIKNREPTPASSVRRADRQWLVGTDNVLYNYLRYLPGQRSVYRLQAFQFDGTYRLTGRLAVDRASYAGDGWWVVQDGWLRRFASRGSAYENIEEPRRMRLSLTPEMIEGEDEAQPIPDAMTYGQLRDYIAELRAAGRRDTRMLEVGLHNKIAYPAMCLVMALVALPFSFRLGRKGTLYGIGMSLLLGIAFFVVLAAFTAVGESGILPPLIAVWSPGAIFAVFSLYLFLGVRT